MHRSQIAIFLFSIVLGCRQFIQWATAFGRPSLCHFRIRTPKFSIALKSTEEDQEEDAVASFEQLMDEAVLLYSVVSQRTKFDDNTEADESILKLRRDELTVLVKDAVLEARDCACDGIAGNQNDSVEAETRPTKLETVQEIRQALDDQILLGYEATFTQEELEEWIETIDSLHKRLQSKLAALPPGSEHAAAVAPTEPAPTPLDSLYDRLETMRTLIDPVGTDRLRLPLAKGIVETDNSEVVTEPSSKESPLPEENVPTKLDVENAFIESFNEAATKIETEDINDTQTVSAMGDNKSSELEMENAFLEAVNEAAESNSTVSDPEPSEKVSSSTAGNESSELQIENAFFEAVNDAAESKNGAASDPEPLEKISLSTPEKKPSELELENALLEAMNQAAESTSTDPANETVATAPPKSNHQDPIEGTDVVSSVVVAAALSAAAVTANPLFAAGVALGPVIRESIASAKSRVKGPSRATAKANTNAKSNSVLDRKTAGEDNPATENDTEGKPN